MKQGAVQWEEDEALRPQLAARFDEAMASAQDDAARQELPPLFRDGSVKISARQPLHRPFPGAEISGDSVPRITDCRVIYVSPFYLAHTPGLFEGKLNVDETWPQCLWWLF